MTDDTGPNALRLPAPPAALDKLHMLLAGGTRRLLGLVGPPGAGKSTLATVLHAAAPTQTQVVPMDGFHLATTRLQGLGRAGRKGAPDTFDVDGLVVLLQRLRSQAPGTTVYAPEFRREIEEPIAAAIAIDAGTPLLIVEGNYLLLDTAPWDAVSGLLDEVWYLAVDDALRTERLIARHVAHGRTPQAARDWVTQTDEPNARRIAATQSRADWTVSWDRDA